MKDNVSYNLHDYFIESTIYSIEARHYERLETVHGEGYTTKPKPLYHNNVIPFPLTK